LTSLLLTTSRKTSNRVRSFVRDLSSVLPNLERFNRGGMGLPELVARINQNDARAAIVVSIWRGNPGQMTVLSPKGEETINIRLESVLLRREVNPSRPARTGRIANVLVKSGSRPQVKALAEDIATLLNLDLSEREDPHEYPSDASYSFAWLEDSGSGKILWTHYTTLDGAEIGPRIRISAVRRKSPE
jgi:U3 small nucleolar ribonucleoprotein protein IMP4